MIGDSAQLFNASWHFGARELVLRANKAVSHQHISFTVIAANSLELPKEGINRDATQEFNIRADLNEGPIQNTKFDYVDTVGISSANVSYSSLVAGRQLGLKMELTTTGRIEANESIKLNLENFELNTTTPVVESCHNERDCGEQLFTASWKGKDECLTDTAFEQITGPCEVLTLTATKELKAGDFWFKMALDQNLTLPSNGLVKNGLMLSSDAASFGPTAGIIPKSKAVGAFESTSFSYEPRAVGEVVAITLVFGLGPGILTGGDGAIYLDLPDATIAASVDSTNLVLNGTHASLFTAAFASNRLVLTPKDDMVFNPMPHYRFGAYTVVVSEANMITLTSSGIDLNERDYILSSTISTAPVIGEVIDVPAVGMFTHSAIEYQSSKLGINVGFRLSFSYSKEIARGETVYLQLPEDFSIPNCTSSPVNKAEIVGAGTDLIFSQNCSHVPHDNSWYIDNSIAFTAAQRVPAETLVKLSSNNRTKIMVPKTGVIANSPNLKIKTDAALAPTDYVALLDSPCMGFCEATITFSATTGGDPTRITLDFQVGADLYAGDHIYVDIPSLNRSSELSFPVLLTGDDAYQFTGQWNNRESRLVLQTEEDVEYDKDKVLSVTVSQTSDIRLPFEGIEQGESFNISTDAILMVTNRTRVRSTVTSTTKVWPGGQFLESSIVYQPKESGEEAALNLTLKLSVPLVAGDSITLKLPGFSGPSVRAGQMELEGLHGQASAELFNATWGNETLQLVAKSNIAAKTMLYLTVAKSNGIVLPTSTLLKNDPSLRISADAAAGRVISHKLTSEHVVGALQVPY